MSKREQCLVMPAVSGGMPISLEDSGDRVLLLNPAAYDVRLPWAKFQQPAHLLRLATALRRDGADVRLIDALHTPITDRIPRRRVAVLDMGDGIRINKWRFGVLPTLLIDAMRDLVDQGWRPDTIHVEGSVAYWWEGVAEIIALARVYFPDVQIVLSGAYPALAPEHATAHAGADELRTRPQPDLLNLPPDLTLYPTPPAIVWLCLGDGSRLATTIVDEIADLSAAGVPAFAFADQSVATLFPDLYRAILEEIIARRLRVKLHALGTLTARELAADPALADLLRRAGYVQLNLADDRAAPLSLAADEEWLNDARLAAQACHWAGFRPRSGEVTAGLCLGRPGETLVARARLATLAADYLGSVIFWPYQPSPSECPNLPLEAQNGRLYPFRGYNGATYRDYLEVLGLGSILNAKYRSRTFDFLGEGLIATLFRESLGRRAWEPDPAVKGGLRLPLPMR